MDNTLGTEATAACTGTGPVDAAFKAIRQLTPGTEGINLLEYTVSSVTAGIDALGEVTVRLQDKSEGGTGRIAFGRSANVDVIVASAQAYLNAVNRLVSLKGAKSPVHPQFNSIG